MLIEKNRPLKPFNTFGISALAREFAEIRSKEDVEEVCHDILPGRSSRLILGGGSNILLTGDFNGIVIKNCLEGISVTGDDGDFVRIRACAGENWHSFVMHCLKSGFFGLENLSLIPGCVGASPMQNIGAYGVEVKDLIESVEAFHVEEKAERMFTAEECRFGYRDSIFKNVAKDKYIITAVNYRLTRNPVLNTSYGAIEQELEAMGVKDPGPLEVSQAVISIRRSKLPDPAEIGNAGSFFKNPVISKEKYDALRSAFPEIPGYDQADGVKVPAGWLIESLGWKGKRFGDAGVHVRQALVLVNYGGAGGSEIFDLSQKILDSVQEKYDIMLEREVNIV